MRGGAIDGEVEGEYLGEAVALSGNANVVAVGAPRHNNFSGKASVFVWETGGDGGDWQGGGEVLGEISDDQAGASLALSALGDTIAVGARFSIGSGNSDDGSGNVRVFREPSSRFGAPRPLGSPLKGNCAGDKFGYSVAMNADGTVVAAGAPTTNWGGVVQAYRWDESRSDWEPMGQALGEEEWFGSHVALSGDGTVLAIAAYLSFTEGFTKAFRFDAVATRWVQIGDTVHDANVGDASSGVSLNADGTLMAIGAVMNNDNGEDSGHVRVFRLVE